MPDLSSSVFVFGDVHGQIGLLKGLLLKAGLLERIGETAQFRRCGRRDLAARVISIGDLVDGRQFFDWADRRLLEVAPEWMDCALVGNHELSFLGGLEFSGIWDDEAHSLRRRLVELEQAGFYVPALVEGRTLLTHAGLSSSFPYESAVAALQGILACWRSERAEMLVSGCSDQYGRGGIDPAGGICWLDWGEQRNPRFSQIVGHSILDLPEPSQLELGEGIVHTNLDLGGKHGKRLAGVFLEDGRITNAVVFERECDEDDLDWEEMPASEPVESETAKV